MTAKGLFNKKHFLYGIFSVIAGLIAIIWPKDAVEFLVILFGFAAITDGIVTLTKIKMFMDGSIIKKTVIIRALVSILIGLLAVTFPFIFRGAISTVIAIFTYILAIYALLAGAIEFYIALQLKNDTDDVKSLVIQAFIYLAVSLVLFLLGARLPQIIMRVVGIALVIFGIIIAIVGWKKKPIEIKPEDVEIKDAPESTEEQDDSVAEPIETE